MIVTGPEDLPRVFKDKELPLEKYGALGVVVVMAGEAGPVVMDMDSKVLPGMEDIEVWERCKSRCRGRSTGGLGAGPGFMNWPAL